MDIVYEWEDILVDYLGCKFKNDLIFKSNPRPFGCLSEFITKCQLGTKNLIKFDIDTRASLRCNYSNVIPIVIDFFEKEEDLSDFYKRYENHKVVYITSREAYDFLLARQCPLHIEHLALSLSDKYKICPTTRFEKQYDLVVVGRKNPVFEEWLTCYHKTHPDFSFIYPKTWEKPAPWKIYSQCYYSSTGERIGFIESRKDYMKILKKSKIALYSTPSMDNNNSPKNGWNQVTPRFLEYLACGCHVLCRYPENSDTRYYELEKYWPSLNSYEEFEVAVDKARDVPVDMRFYSEYLQKHYTSVRAEQLFQSLKSL